MRNATVTIIFSAIMIMVISGCSKEPESITESQESSKSVDSSDSFSATVVSATNAGRYTYIELNPEDAGEGRLWVATTTFGAKTGDKVQVFNAYLMKDFHSPTLKRTFKEIYFTGTVVAEGDLPPKSGQPSGGMGKFYSLGTNSPHGNPHANPHGGSKGGYHNFHGTPENKVMPEDKK